MRTWQRRAMVWIASPARALSMRTLKISCGAAAKASGSARSTRKVSSGTGLLLEMGEELADFGPELVSTRQAATVSADQPLQAISLVDAHKKIVALLAHPVDQQRLDVGRHLPQHRVVLGQ